MIYACSQMTINGRCLEIEEVMVGAMTNGTSKREPHVNTAPPWHAWEHLETI
jgi:hypothetical protein